MDVVVTSVNKVRAGQPLWSGRGLGGREGGRQRGICGQRGGGSGAAAAG